MKRILKSLAVLGVATCTLLLAVMAVSPKARAEILNMNLPCAWGTIDGALVQMTIAGVQRPATTLGVGLGDSTHRYSSSYINRAVGATINCTNSTLTTTNVGLVFVTNMSGNHTLTLPTAALAGAGGCIEVIDVGGKVDATHQLTVNVTSAGNINGADTFGVNNATYEHATFYSNGSAWFGSVSTKTN